MVKITKMMRITSKSMTAMKKRNIILVLVLLLFPFISGAQVLKGSYFLDHSINRHKMNPAFAPRANYFQLPVIGNTGVGIYSNLDVPLLTYPVGDKLGTFLHPSVSPEQFRRDLPAHLHFDADIQTTILSFGGFNKKKAFWNFTIDTRMMYDMDLPSDLFLFVKQGVGTQSQKYNIGNINAYATAALQASFGYSREWMKGLRAGFKVRAIAPIAYFGLNLEDVSLTTGADKWTVNTNGYLYTSMAGLDVKMSDGSLGTDFDMNKFLSNKGLAGFGYSVDLGVEYTLEIGCPVDGLAFSLAVTDLGQIFYKKDCVSAFENEGSMDWIGFHVDENLNLNTDQAMADLESKASGLFNLKEMEHPQMFERSTMPRLYAGVELPFLKRTMSVGLLYSARFSHSYARHELTASYNITPCRWFALGLNYSFLNTTRSMGAMLEFTPKAGPCFFLGMDYVPMEFVNAPLLEDILGASPGLLSMLGVKTTSWALPTSSRFNMNFGLAFNLGSKHVNPKKEKKNKTK